MSESGFPERLPASPLAVPIAAAEAAGGAALLIC